jgi:hypothetical protein
VLVPGYGWPRWHIWCNPFYCCSGPMYLGIWSPFSCICPRVLCKSLWSISTCTCHTLSVFLVAAAFWKLDPLHEAPWNKQASVTTCPRFLHRFVLLEELLLLVVVCCYGRALKARNNPNNVVLLHRRVLSSTQAKAYVPDYARSNRQQIVRSCLSCCSAEDNESEIDRFLSLNQTMRVQSISLSL